MGKFIKAAEAYDPSTLFVVTGDHAERFNFSNDVSCGEKAAFPASSMALALLRTFAKDAAGSHLQIAPTLAELILSQGETYESLLPLPF